MQKYVDIPELKNQLKHKTLERARQLCQGLGMRLTVTKVNGESTVTTADYDSNRVRVEVTDDKISEVCGLG